MAMRFEKLYAQEKSRSLIQECYFHLTNIIIGTKIRANEATNNGMISRPQSSETINRCSASTWLESELLLMLIHVGARSNQREVKSLTGHRVQSSAVVASLPVIHTKPKSPPSYRSV